MKKLLLPLFLLISIFGEAQNGFTSYSCTIAGSNPLFLNRSAITIDNSGNKWIGFKRLNTSAMALIKYDGTNWTNYTSSINAPVLSLAADAVGTVWIGTLNAGLIKYDGSTFTSYTRSNSGIISDSITALAVINGNVYAGSDHGFSEFDGTTFTNYSSANSGLSSNSILCFEQENTQTWIGTTGGLNRLNGGIVTYVGSSYQINDIMVDASGNKWLATEIAGLLKYDNVTISPLSLSTPIVGAQIPFKLKSISKSINNNPIVNSERYVGPGTYQKNGLIEILPGNTYRLFVHNLVLSGDAIFASDINSEIYFIDSKLSATTGLNPKKCLFSFDQNQYIPSASILAITPENTQFLDINNVSAGCNPSSDIHWDGIKSLYEVPKGSGSNPTFSTAFWMGGYVNGQLRVAANTYRQTGVDFWPGPIDTNTGTTDTATTQQFNRVWKINRFDIENFKFNYLVGNVQNGTFPIPNEILTWPGNGSFWGDVLAPYFDYNSDMYYNPHDGDYPLIKGDQMLWWVFNDHFSNHTETGSVSDMGVQVQVSAYAYTCPSIADSDKVVNYTTFYNYKVINKSTNTIDSIRIGIISDADLGNYNDDYVGCDVQNNFAFIYNGDNYDDNSNGVIGYHENTPYFSYNWLYGPYADLNDGMDNDHDGCIDCTYDGAFTSIDDDLIPERMAMSGFLPYNNTGDARTGNPTTVGNGIQYYRYLNSLWKDGTPLAYDNGNGTSFTSGGYPRCTYLYPGSSDPIGYGLGGNAATPVSSMPWTESNSTTNNLPGDRRFLVSTGKFTLQPGSYNEFDFAYVFTQDSASLANGVLYNKVVADNRKIKNWFTDNNTPSCLDLSGVGLKESDRKVQMLVFPNPASSSLTIDAGNSNTILKLKVYDILGKEIFAQENIRTTKSQLNINGLNPGVYLLEVQSEQGAYFTKFVKQ